jgi:hypothetical protein
MLLLNLIPRIDVTFSTPTYVNESRGQVTAATVAQFNLNINEFGFFTYSSKEVKSDRPHSAAALASQRVAFIDEPSTDRWQFFPL